MALSMSTVSEGEMRDVVEMLFMAYEGSSSFVNAVYPHKITDDGIEGLDMVVARLQYLRQIDPSIRWYKVTDPSTGKIVSASQWNVYDKEKPPEMMLDGPEGSWATPKDKKYAIEMFEAFIMPRYTRYREVDVPIVCKFNTSRDFKAQLNKPGLNIMGTAKDYQHQGAATMQVKEFNRIADELSALITTESTTAARWLYEKNGYVVSKNPGHWVIEAKSKEFSEKPKEWLFFMERPRAK